MNPKAIFAVAVVAATAACSSSSSSDGDATGVTQQGLSIEPLSADRATVVEAAARARGSDVGAMAFGKGYMTHASDGAWLVAVPDARVRWRHPTFARIAGAGVTDLRTVTPQKKTAGNATTTQSLGIQAMDCAAPDCVAARAHEEETLENYLNALGTDVDWVYALVWYNAVVAANDTCDRVCPGYEPGYENCEYGGGGAFCP